MSSSLLRNTFPCPKCILSSSPTNKHISSSLSIKENKTYRHSTKTIKSNTNPKSLPTTILWTLCNALDDFINNFIDPPRFPAVDPKHVLSGNFAPVDELPPTECVIIEGTIPPSLEGAYIRNGPNPQYFPTGPYNLIDGDGMLHCLRFSNGRVTLCSRYVRTYKYCIELEAGSRVFPNFFSDFHGLPAMVSRGAISFARVLCGQFDPMKGMGVANATIAFLGDKLFALGEPDLPYQICLTKNGDIETIERYDFEGKLSSMSMMTAHPKKDVQSGETFAFKYGPTAPFLTYFRFNPDGSKQADVPISSIKSLTFIHDFAITTKYAIFVDIQIGMPSNPIDLILGGGSIMRVDQNKVSRIGVIPKYANDESEMRWYDAPGFNVMHAINAWEEDDGIVLIATNISPVEHTLEAIELMHSSLEKVRIDFKSATVTRTPMSTKCLDFGVINPSFLGRKTRYGYAGIANRPPKISGVVKLDWSSEGGREVGCRLFGDGCYGGEPFFVANNTGGEKEEDDGYLVTYVHDENSGESRFLVMDAKSPSLDIVATIKLPRRVPYGFHGIFLRDIDLVKLSLDG